MKAQGIRILDKNNLNGIQIGFISLIEILDLVEYGNDLFWSILFLNSIGDLGFGKSIPIFQEQIINSEKGLFINWNDLIKLSKKLDQIIQLVLIGCKNREFLHRYDTDQEMYESCDIVIEMVDSHFWEVFSKDENFIQDLAEKFNNTIPLMSDNEY